MGHAAAAQRCEQVGKVTGDGQVGRDHHVRPGDTGPEALGLQSAHGLDDQQLQALPDDAAAFDRLAQAQDDAAVEAEPEPAIRHGVGDHGPCRGATDLDHRAAHVLTLGIASHGDVAHR